MEVYLLKDFYSNNFKKLDADNQKEMHDMENGLMFRL